MATPTLPIQRTNSTYNQQRRILQNNVCIYIVMHGIVRFNQIYYMRQ